MLSIISPSFEPFILRVVSNIESAQVMLSSMGGILATILAISFSIAIIVIQFAASSYTASILESYKQDTGTVIFFGFFVGALILSIVALDFRDNLVLANEAVIMFVFSFFVLGAHYIHIINLIDPRTIIEKSEKRAIKYIKSVPSKIQSLVSEKKPKNEFEKLILEEPLYKEYIFHNDVTLQEPIRKQILLINDVINKAVYRREIETTSRGFQALISIIKEYIGVRKEDLTPEDQFLDYIHRQLLSTFTAAYDNKDASLMQEVLRTFQSIGCLTTNLKSIGNRPNNVTNIIIFHLKDCGKKALEGGFVDVSTTAIFAMRTIGLQSVKKTGGEGLSSQYIFEIGELGVTKKDWYVLAFALAQLQELCVGLVSFKGQEYSAESVIEDIEKLATEGLQAQIDRWALQQSLFAWMPEYSIRRVAWAALKIKNESYPQIETFAREEYCKNVTAKLVETLGRIAMTSAQTRSLYSLGPSVDCLFDLSLLMLQEEFKTVKNSFEEEIGEIIQSLKETYLEIASYAFVKGRNLLVTDEIGDAITSIGVLAFDSHKKITDECIDSLNEMSLRMIKLDKIGYDVPRLAARLGVIGAYALSKNVTNIADKAAEQLARFNSRYVKESPSPHENEVFEEISNLHKKPEEAMIGMEATKKFEEIFQEVPDKYVEAFIERLPRQKAPE